MGIMSEKTGTGRKINFYDAVSEANINSESWKIREALG